jgi:hypothetical protein
MLQAIGPGATMAQMNRDLRGKNLALAHAWAA